jgi:hypothetical protein
MSEAGSRLRKLDAITSTAVRFAIFCVWPTVVAIALGATLFAATHADLLPAMFENGLTPNQRRVGLGYFAVSVVKKREGKGKVELLERRDRWSLYRAVTPPKTQ